MIKTLKSSTYLAAIATGMAMSLSLATGSTNSVAVVIEQSGPNTQMDIGGGLVASKSGVQLKAGDRVYAGDASSITIKFPKTGCVYKVEPQTYYRVSETEPCKSAGLLPKMGSNGAMLGVGAAAAVGGAVLLLKKSGDDDSSPASAI